MSKWLIALIEPLNHGPRRHGRSMYLDKPLAPAPRQKAPDDALYVVHLLLLCRDVEACGGVGLGEHASKVDLMGVLG